MSESDVKINYHNDIFISKLNGVNIKHEITDTSETIDELTNANENIEIKRIKQLFIVNNNK